MQLVFYVEANRGDTRIDKVVKVILRHLGMEQRQDDLKGGLGCLKDIFIACKLHIQGCKCGSQSPFLVKTASKIQTTNGASLSGSKMKQSILFPAAGPCPHQRLLEEGEHRAACHHLLQPHVAQVGEERHPPASGAVEG